MPFAKLTDNLHMSVYLAETLVSNAIPRGKVRELENI